MKYVGIIKFADSTSRTTSANTLERLELRMSATITDSSEKIIAISIHERVGDKLKRLQ